jgi:hypothetical protein
MNQVHLEFECSVQKTFEQIRLALAEREKKLLNDSKQIQLNKGNV